MVGKTDKNNAARHGFDMSFIPVSNGRFLRVAVRVNHPGVAVIRTAQQTLLVEIARHVAAGVKGFLPGLPISPITVTVVGFAGSQSV